MKKRVVLYLVKHTFIYLNDFSFKSDSDIFKFYVNLSACLIFTGIRY
jgi:hypothetical protein